MSAIVNRRDLHAHVLTYQRPIRELRFPGIIEDEGLFVSTTLKRGFLKRGTVSRTRKGGGGRRKGERRRERENAVRLGSSNEYNQNGLVEKQPRAIPLLVYTAAHLNLNFGLTLLDHNARRSRRRHLIDEQITGLRAYYPPFSIRL